MSSPAEYTDNADSCLVASDSGSESSRTDFETDHSSLPFSALRLSVKRGPSRPPLQIELCFHNDWPDASTDSIITVHFGAEESASRKPCIRVDQLDRETYNVTASSSTPSSSGRGLRSDSVEPQTHDALTSMKDQGE